MRQTARIPGGALTLALLALIATPLPSAAASLRRQCREACADEIAACVEIGGRPRVCRRAILPQCRREGVVFCQGPADSGASARAAGGGALLPPTSLVASAASSSAIDLGWGDPNSRELGYLVERAPSATSGFTAIATLGSNARSYRDSGLAAATTYYYRVRAYGRKRTFSAYSNVTSAATSSPGIIDTTPPSVPAGVGATPVTCTQVNLGWNASTDTGSGMKGYNVYRGGVFLKQVLAPATTTSDTGLDPSTIYTYTIAAIDNANNVSAPSLTATAATPGCADTAPPATPTGLNAAPASCTQVSLSWLASGDSGGSGLQGYRLYRNSVFLRLVAAPATSNLDTGLTGATTFSYAVSAVDNAGNESSRSTAVSATTPSCVTTTTAPSTTTTTRPPTTTTTRPPTTTTTTIPPTTTTRPPTTTTTATVTTTTATTTTLANQMPVANAGPDQATQTLISIAFNGSGSYDPDGTITSYAWNFGDGATANGMAAAHTYGAPGTYTVTLTVTDNRGAARADTAAMSILNRPPVANAGPDKSATAGTAVSLSGSGTDADGTVSSYAWAFGDGGTATGTVVSHVYTTPGTYTATLTVTDNRGATDTDSAVVTASGATTASSWVRTGGGANTQSANATAYDSGGNVLVGGIFMGTLTLGGTSLVSAGAADSFVAKYDPTGRLLWVRQIGGAGDDMVEDVAVDDADNVLVTGRFSGSANTAGGTVVSAGGLDILVVKYDSGGGHVWSQRFGGALNDFGYGIDADASGNVYFTGAFSGTINFGGGARTVPYTSDLDVYLTKLSPGGTYLWDKTFVNNADESGYSVAVSPIGEVAIAGIFKGDINFGGGSIRATYQPVARGLNDGFVAKFSTSGGYLWARQFGSDREDGAFGVAMDASGNVTVTGQVRGSVDFGGGSTTGSEFEWDAFVAQYSTNGTHRWSRRMGGTLEDVGNDVTVDSGGNVTVTGQYRGSSSFGGNSFTSAGALDIFVAQYGPTGTHRWSESWGGAADDRGFGVAAGPGGQVAATGWFKGAATIAGTSVGSVDAWPDAYLVQRVP